MAESEAHKRANARWQKGHRKQQRHYSDKSSAKRFILKESTISDLNLIDHWSRIRRHHLSNL